MGTPHSDIRYIPIAADDHHDGNPALDPLGLGLLGIAEIFHDMLLHFFLKTGPFVRGISTAWEYGHMVMFVKGDRHVLAKGSGSFFFRTGHGLVHGNALYLPLLDL